MRFRHATQPIFQRNPLGRRILFFIPVLLLALFPAGPASAHKVTVFAWVEGDTVYGETKFSGGRPAMDAEIVVTGPEGNQLLTTRTDDQGEFSFKIPQKTELKIQLMAGAGHQGDWTIRAEEIGPADEADTGSSMPPPPSSAPASPVPASADKTVSNAAIAVSPEALQSMVETAMDKKLKPILKMLADAHDPGPSVTEIIGGIGYIFGLMGIGMYFHARRKLDQANRP
jgi:nickel transport protein